MTIDVHSHMIPGVLLNNRDFGLEYEKGHGGTGSIKAWGITVGPVQDNMFEPELQVADMDNQGIDKKVLSVPPFLFAYNKELEFAKYWCRSYNDTLSEICSHNPDRFAGFAAVPLQDSGAAVDEMVRCLGEKKLVGIEIGTNVNGLDLDDDGFADFFSEANRIGCSVLIHPNNVLAPQRLNCYYLKNTVGNPVETSIAAARLILSGFFYRYPNIRVCFSHGGGALPFILSRIEHGMKVRPETSDAASRPSLFKGVFFDSIVYNQRTLRYLIDTCGIKTVVLGSDYPFDMGMEQPVGFVRTAADEIEQRMILEDNPKTFLFGK
jgi:aminocarboxymuconate-semialdehyde decarboxylase